MRARDSTQKKLSPQSSICEATAKRFRAAVCRQPLRGRASDFLAHTHPRRLFEVNESQYLRAMATHIHTRSDASLFGKD
jgi:hypothetical protein